MTKVLQERLRANPSLSAKPDDLQEPKDADFRGWKDLLANGLAAGESAARLGSYLKKAAVETWDYINWLTHARNAVRMDAEIGLKMVEHLLGVFTAARLRLGQVSLRCETCGSYEVVAGVCGQCDWADPSYEPAKVRQWSAAERESRLAEPCTRSDISTYMRPKNFL